MQLYIDIAAHRDLEISVAVVKLQKTRITYFKVKTNIFLMLHCE